MRLLSTIISILTIFSLSAKAQNHDSEHVILNEISMRSGCEYDYSNPDAAKSLPTIRQLLLEGRNNEAQKVMYERFVPKKSTEGAHTYCTCFIQKRRSRWRRSEDFPIS